MKRGMIAGFLLLLSGVFEPPTVLCQEQFTDTSALRAGSWSLQFGVGSNFTLTSFQGATIAAKYHLSGTSALRAGITVNGSNDQSTSLTTTDLADTLSTSGSQDGSSSQLSVSLNLQYLWYLNPDGLVHFYLALGPSVSYMHSASDRTGSTLNTGGNPAVIGFTTTSRSTDWAAGLRGGAGVEWFATRWLSIQAEYAYVVDYEWTSSSDNVTSTPTVPGGTSSSQENSVKTKGWRFNNLGVIFGINVYL